MRHSVAEALKWSQALYQQVVDLLPAVMVATAIFLVFALLAFFAGASIKRHGSHHQKNKMVFNLIAKLLRFSILLLGLICALGAIGISISTLVTSLGLVGFAVGFALKDILTSTLAGVLLLIHRPFRVRDYVAVKGVEGEVIEIDLRFTVLKRDGQRIMVPNSIMLKEAVTVTPAGN